ncbi:tetratricopeptide repeat protein [Aquisalimonas sp.]|uniref:tetratricopeptide repeat protein n=1 Tax=unclassified Aquisalimonas TaxID=2644645 RepID=UPI0025BB3EAE|nr:tetratricopeptide repeat protein [Aquisalimonas sp.]
MLDRLEKLLESGQDSPMLRLSLGQGYLKEGRHEEAVDHLRQALKLQQDYSAAWKALGQALAAAGDPDGARAVYDDGIRIARDKGDLQAAKEMEVFRKRLDKQSPG